MTEIIHPSLNHRSKSTPDPQTVHKKSRFTCCVPVVFYLATAIMVTLSYPCPIHAQPDTPPQSGEPSFQRRESVLERFRAYSGEKNKAALGRLFQQTDPSFSQAPPLLLADGTSKASVTIRFFGRGDQLPIFSVAGGHCTAAHPAGSNAWTLEIVPNSGSLSTSVTVLAGGNMIEYPLTVAPPMRLFNRNKAVSSTVEYVVIANELAAGRTSPSRK
jgi:hypothetical protein